MCGRYTYLYTWRQLHRLMGLTAGPEFEPRYNVAPTQQAPVVIASPDGSRALEMMKWGLIPSWAKDASIGNRSINARCETVATQPAFRDAFKKRRCLVPVSGFYEWQAVAGEKGKRPWYFRQLGGEPMFLGGLWESWHDTAGDEVHTYTVMTTTPNDLLRPLHDRMPVIVRPEFYKPWLAHEPLAADRAAAVFAPFPADLMEAYRVSTRVNSPKHDAPDCIEPIESEPGSLFG